jgi:acyl-CoA reductase-like NAD-dependent aldehyde dehydrogenase
MGHNVRNYIAGEWIAEAADRMIPNINPADTDEVLGQVPLMDRAMARRAIDAAKEAFPGWRATPAPKRGAILFEALRILRGRAEELATVMTREEGKTLADSRGEVQKSLNLLEFIAGEGRRLAGETLPSEMPSTVAYTVREPMGVVALITPWNFPVAIPVWKIAPALVSGNCAVFKPATLTPWSGEIIVDAFVEAGLPPGVLSFITGSGGTVGEELISHPEVKAVSFTGSNEVGMHLYEVAARTGKRVQCEMGGKNPVVVLRDGDLAAAAEGICQGAFASTGQRCTATSRVVVEKAVAAELTERIVEGARRFVVGNGLKEGVTMGPCVDAGQLETVLGYLETARKEGARFLCGGERLQDDETRRGFFVAPTVLGGVTPQMTVAREEIFGPVLSIIEAADFDEALRIANDVRYGLSASIYTADVRRAFEFIDGIEVGIVHVNSPTVGGEAQLPFGGVKETGVGPREQGNTAIEFYTELKTVYVDFTGQARQTKIY